MRKKSRTDLNTRGFEAIVYPSMLNVVVNRHFSDIKQSDRRRKNYDLHYCDSITLEYPWQDWNKDIPEEENYYKCYQIVRDWCIKIKQQLEEKFFYKVHYAFNMHDRDVGKDGKFLDNHFHVYMWTDDTFGCDQPDFVIELRNYMIQFFGVLSVQDEHIDFVDDSLRKYNDPKSGHIDVIEYHLVRLSYLINPMRYVVSCIKYLIHIDNNDKELYLLEDCCSDIDLSRHKAFVDSTRASQLFFLFDNIDCGNIRSFTQLAKFARENGCIEAFMKNSHILNNYINSFVFGKDPLKDAFTGLEVPEAIQVNIVPELNTLTFNNMGV